MPKWIKISEGHYSVPAGRISNKLAFVHVEGTRVYLTDGTYSYTTPITGEDRKKFLASAKSFAAGSKAKRSIPPLSKKHKQQATKAAKSVIKGVGKAIGTVRAFATMIGEVEEESYKRKRAPQVKRIQRQPRQPQTLEEYMGWR
jgi:hypothetical protein